MSIYSGFATRMLENSYNSLLFNMLNHLAARLAEFVGQGLNEQIWTDEFSKLYKQLTRFESSKYLPPKFSASLKVLATKYECTSSFSSNPISRDSVRSRPSRERDKEMIATIPNPIIIPDANIIPAQVESSYSISIKNRNGRRNLHQDRVKSSDSTHKSALSTSVEYEAPPLDFTTPKIRSKLFTIRSGKKKRVNSNISSGKYVQDMALIQLYNEIGAT